MSILFQQLPVDVVDGALPVIPAADIRLLSPAEEGAVEHWLFGGDSSSLAGLKGVSAFTPQSNTHTFSAASVSVVSTQGQALVSTLSDSLAQTLIGVVKRVVDPEGDDNVLLFGTLGSSSGSGAFIPLSSAGVTFTTRPLGSSPTAAWPSGLDVGKWMFVAFTEKMNLGAGSNKERHGYIIHQDVMAHATHTSSTEKTLAVPKIAIGNGQYADAAYNGGPAVEAAEFIYYDRALPLDEIVEVYRRSVSRMAERGNVL